MKRAILCLGLLVACDDSDPGVADTAAGADAADTVRADGVEDIGDTAADDVAPADSGADTAAPGDTAATSDGADGAGPVGKTLSYVIEPITVRSGEERQVCKTINIPSDAAFDIVRFESQMRGISHHFNLYKVIDQSAFAPVTAEESTTHDCAPAAEQLRGDAAYIYGSASPERIMETPPGVAFHLEPGQRLILEYHAINYTTEPIEASLQIDLHGAAPDAVIEHHADIIWFANWGFMLPPGRETSDTTRCEVPYDVEIFGLMSHFHELGTHFTIDAIQRDTETQVYESEDWSHPVYERYAPALSLAAGDALQWTCTWNNTRDKLVMPNKGSKDEMCMVFAAAYPKTGLSAEPIQCNVFF